MNWQLPDAQAFLERRLIMAGKPIEKQLFVPCRSIHRQESQVRKNLFSRLAPLPENMPENRKFLLDLFIGSRFTLEIVTAMTILIFDDERSRTMKNKVTVEEWVGRFRAVGLDDAAMETWHRLFERENPAGHQGFLEWLGLPEEKITTIRAKYA